MSATNNNPLLSAKAALAHANNAFPTSFGKSAIGSPKAEPAKPAPVKPAATGLGEELKAKGQMMDKARSALPPRMHSGGPVMTSGAYRLKAGEHVLTEAEAKNARKHALMVAGMKSLSKSPESKSKMGNKQEKVK